MKQANVGLEGFYFGDTLETGLSPDLSAMTLIDDIVPDSVVAEKEDDTTVELKSQETGDVFTTLISEVGKTAVKFGTWNFKVDNIILALGGSKDANGTWSAPTNVFSGISRAIAYVTRAKENGLHMVYKYPLVNFKGKEEGIQQEGDANKIQFDAVMLTPTDANGVKMPNAYKEYVPAHPTSLIIDDATNSFAWEEVNNFKDATDYEYSIDGGTSFSDCTANPQTGVTGAVAIGDLHLRVKAVTSEHKAGFVVKNTEAFTA